MQSGISIGSGFNGHDILPADVEVPKLQRKRGLARIGAAKVLYPHELWAFLSKQPKRFADVFMPQDPEEVSIFWQFAKDEVWFMEHPLRFLVSAAPQSRVPILIYGDEAPMGKLGKRLMRMQLWYSPFRKQNGADGNLALCMDDISDTFATTIHRQQLLAVAWSFGIATTNVWPHEKHDGTPLTPADGYRWRMRGQKLNDDNVIPIVIGFTGDLQWDLKEFAPPFNWSTRPCICNICHATHALGPLSAFNPAEDADWTATARSNDDGDWLPNSNPLYDVAGAHRHAHFEDYVHEDLLGTRQLLNGGAMRYACGRGWFGDFPAIATWKEKLQAQLDVAYLHFGRVINHGGIQCSQQKFTVGSLSLAKSQHATAVTKGKAFNGHCVSVWLLQLFQERQDADLESQMICTSLWGFCAIWDVAMDVKRRSSIICTEAEVERLRLGRRAAFSSLRWLAANAYAHGLSRFHLRPKFHLLDHCLRRCVRTRICFIAFWVFQQEDSMGKWAKVALKVHASVVCARTIERWLALFVCPGDEH